ncbi:MAG: polyprenyl synthetase family protein [Nannocystaceae bacterium]
MASHLLLESRLRDDLQLISGGPSVPPRLSAAMSHACLGGGARLRPLLCHAVSKACGGTEMAASAPASAIEFLHCASLVHDDLPCFDDAAERRGQPSVHVAFGEPLAVLTGDALIVGAFQILSNGSVSPAHLPALLRCVSEAVSATRGIIGGQAWECEPTVTLARYHRAKTGALFEAAARCGAIVSGQCEERWAEFGILIGEAYQVADDLHDALEVRGMGKPAGQDQVHGRPNAVLTLGLPNALERLESLLDAAFDAVPQCENPQPINTWLGEVAERLQPTSVQHPTSAALSNGSASIPNTAIPEDLRAAR